MKDMLSFNLKATQNCDKGVQVIKLDMIEYVLFGRATIQSTFDIGHGQSIESSAQIQTLAVPFFAAMSCPSPINSAPL
jgi:hypothetical protein